MRCLLDTHTYLWSVTDSSHLSNTARGVIRDIGNEPLLSIASLWEIAIKLSVGKLDLDATFLELAVEIPTNSAWRPCRSRRGTSLPCHGYRFMITATRSIGCSWRRRRWKNLPIVSGDAALDAYGIARIW